MHPAERADPPRDARPQGPAPAADQLERHAARMQVLAEASEAFAQAGQDLDAVLNSVARRIAELVGGACTVRLLSADGRHLELAALFHSDSERAEAARAILESTPQHTDEGIAAAVVGRGETVLIAHVDQAALRASLRPAYHAHLDRWPVVSLLAVPLRARSAVVGMLQMTRYEGDPPFAPDDAPLLRRLAEGAALAIEGARLYQAERLAREEAEATMADLARLHQVVATLAEAMTPAEASAAAAAQIVQLVPVARGTIGLVSEDGSALEAVATFGEDHVGWRRQPLGEISPQADVVREGAAQYWGSRDSLLARYPGIPRASLRGETWAILPLQAEGRVLGVLSLGFPEPYVFAERERRTLDALARQLAATLQRTRSYAQVQEARAAAVATAERAERLLQVSGALAQALTPREVAEVVMRHGIAAVGAAAGALVVLDPDGGSLSLVSSIGYPPGLWDSSRPLPIDADLPIVEAARAGAPIWVETPEQYRARYPALVGALPLTSPALAALPLTAHGRTVGALGLTFAEPHTFGPDERRFMVTLAQTCAQALERARLYALEQEAREAAERALAVRETFISVAAHELRTPLTSLMAQAQMLLRRAERDGHLPERDLRTAGVIASQTRRLNRLVQHLLDITRLARGQLALEREPMDLGLLTEQVIHEMQPTVPGHELRYAGPDAPVMIDGDALRLEQVIQNLISNAVKYSPAGGVVRFTLAAEGGAARLQVSDTGIGIPEQALPSLFEPFFRASNVDPTVISGLGLGLYIVQDIVLRHGGAVEVESREGQGSTFTVAIPLRRP